MKKEERPPVILSVVPAGTPSFPRFRISDQFARYWNAIDGWTEPQNEAYGTLYDSANEACHEVRRLLMLEYGNLPCKTYKAPVYLHLYADKEVSKEDLQKWLVKVSKLLIDSPSHGNGPVEGSLGICILDWGELEESKK